MGLSVQEMKKRFEEEGGGGGGGCPFHAMSTSTCPVTENGGGIAGIDSGSHSAHVRDTSSSTANAKLTHSLTIMRAISKMKLASRQAPASDHIDAKGQKLLRAEAAKDTRRLNAYLGGMGLAEIAEIEEMQGLHSGGGKKDDNASRSRSTRMLSRLINKEENEGKEESQKQSGRQKEKAEDRYGPFPKSRPVPANAASYFTQDAAQAQPWDPQSHLGGPDERDLNTPDEWIARHGAMIRLSGRHPYNAAPPMSSLLESGFLTPGHLHFTRNHGAVPRLDWDEHKVEVMVHAAAVKKTDNGRRTGPKTEPLVLKMNDLKTDPTVRELPISMGCIGNRRSEFNAIRRTIGFGWGTATIATSVFRGVPLRTVLLKAGVSTNEEDWAGCHVEFVGADELPNKVGEGPFEDEKWGKKVKYGTSVPLGKAMDPARDMMLAFEANGEPIPPDHGYPCRVIVPGSTAARSVKWVTGINVLPHESHNLYHHHDNKILPPHVLDLESSLDPEKRWWYQGEYIVHELNVNSAIALPDHGETIRIDLQHMLGLGTVEEKQDLEGSVVEPSTGDDIEELVEFSGYAYSGGGRRVTRVELSLDAGTNWDITELIVTEAPTAHGMHWCWIFWMAKIPARLLLSTAEVWCRAWDEANNTQPIVPTWNLMGLGQNSVYRLKIHATEDGVITFEHPTQPGGQPGGWMKEPNGLPKSAGFGRIESKEEQAEDEVASPKAKSKEAAKIFTMEEVKKHSTAGDVWIVVNNKVYDCTKYLEFHPGGVESITIYGGRDCTDDFAAVHSNGAYSQLKQYYIGDLAEADAVIKPETSRLRLPQEEEDEALDDDDPIILAVSRSLDSLGQEYGVSAGAMNPADAAVILKSWKRVLANEDAFGEALLGRWRLLVAMEGILKEEGEAKKEEKCMAKEDLDYALRVSGISGDAIAKYAIAVHSARINRKALSMMIENEDPLARVLRARLAITTNFIIGLLDSAVDSLRPFSKAKYVGIDLDRLGLIDGTFEDYMRIFNRCGIQPEHWLLFCQAFLWCMVDVPHLSPMAIDDLTSDKEDGAFSSFISQHVARRAITSIRQMKEERNGPAFRALRRWYRGFLYSGEEASHLLGEIFYKSMIAAHPELMDYFLRSDIDTLSAHLSESIGFTLDFDNTYGAMESKWHDRAKLINSVHREHQIPSSAFALFGGNCLKVMRPLFEQEVKKWEGSGTNTDVTTDALEGAFSQLFVDVISEISHAMLVQEKIIAEGEEFLMQASAELILTDDQLNDRLLEMKLQIAANDSYEYCQTYDEIQFGAHIAFRDVAGCPHRLQCAKLDVWDKRNLTTYEGMSPAIADHLKAVNDGDRNAVLVIFGPRGVLDTVGVRFWTPSFCCYAGYTQDKDKMIGDPANVELTEHLIKHGLWKAPETRTAFDMLPIVIKIPGQKPFAVPIPDDLRKEVNIEHPTCSAIAELNLRSPAFSIVSSMRLCIGGVNYPCCAYNRAFSAAEIVTSLCKRDGLIGKWAIAMGMPESDRLRKKRVLLEMETAVLHSFASQGKLILDDDSMESLNFEHIRKEMEAGRDVIGNDPSHAVARFKLGCHAWKVADAIDVTSGSGLGLDVSIHSTNNKGNISAANEVPVVLIAFGSATGTAEQAALRLGRALKMLRPIVVCLNDVAGLDVIKENNVTHFIAICSTFNRGEFPFNAKKFADAKLGDTLKGVKTGVLALGSTDYPDFCVAGSKLSKQIEKAGGKPCMPLTKVDGAKESESQISNFLSLATSIILPNYLAAALGGNSEEDTLLRNAISWLDVKDKELHLEIHPFIWPQDDALLCIGNEELLAVGGDVDTRSTRRLTFELPSGSTYESGDHLSVLPLNSISMVMRFAFCFKDELVGASVSPSGSCPLPDKSSFESAVIRQLQRQFVAETFDGDEKIGAQMPFETPATLSDVLQSRVDFTLHEGQVADLLIIATKALYASDEAISEEAKQPNIEKIRKLEDCHSKKNESGTVLAFLSEYPTIVNFLEEYHFLCESQSSAAPPLKLANVLAILHRQQPRHYSISSSPIVQPYSVSISVGVLHVTTNKGVPVHGVCSNYLARLRPSEDRAKLTVQISTFRGPSDIRAPVIMVGPGTGLAPMMGFLQERANSVAAGKVSDTCSCHLFFGCRTRDDRIYEHLIDEWEMSGILCHHLALSRDDDTPKTYVQDKMLDMGANLCELLLSESGCVYICGDARVANGCYEACIKVLTRYGHMSRVTAVMRIKKMRFQKRWQYDLWGSVSQFNEIKEQKERNISLAPSEWLKKFQV